MQEPPAAPELLVQAEPLATQQAACNGAPEQPTQDVGSTTAAAADAPQEHSTPTVTLLPDAASAAVATPAAAELASSAAQPQHASPSIRNTSRRSSRTRVGEPAPAPACAPVPVLPCEPAAPQQQQQLLPTATGQSVSSAGALPCADAGAAAASPAAAPRQSDPSQLCRVVAPSYSRSTSSSILSLHIHGTSQLVPDLLLTDPVIRLHVVHAATGEYFPIVQQLVGDGHNLSQQQQRQTALAAARYSSSNSNGPASRLAGSSGNNSNLPHAVDADTQAELLEYPGRPVLTTLDNNTPNPKPGLLQYIPAVQTSPYNITSASGTHSSSSSSSSSSNSGQVPSDRDGGSGSSPGSGGGTRVGLSACWEEELCVDAATEQLAESDALLLLELLQLPGGFSRYKRHACEFGKRRSSHSIAWAFLRLSGLQHRQLVQEQPLKLKLQLYDYSPGALKPEGLLSPRLALPHHHPVSPAKAAYLSFKLSGFLTSAANSSGTSTAPGPAAHASASSTSSSPVRIASSSLQPAPLLPAAAVSSSSSNSWSLGLWNPWGAAVEGSGAAVPASVGRLTSHGWAAAASASKYPAFVEVTLAAVARPQGAVLVTDPAAGIRPALPTGYGSGFEIGRMPVSLLYMPSALRGGRGGGGGAGGSAGCRGLGLDDAFGGAAADESLLLLESRLHRPHTHACQVPNALLAEVKGTAGGCSAISISRDGRWLAAACGDDAGRFKVVLYQALTGRLCWVLGSHYGMVHSISWAKDDSTVVTASADFTVKLWHLPKLPAPASGSPQSSLTRHYSGMVLDRQPLLPYSEASGQQQATAGAGAGGAAGSRPGLACMSGARAGTLDTSCSTLGRGQGDTRHVTGTSCSTSLGAAAAAAGVSVSVLQHTCFVYAAELHPTQQPLPTVVTAGFDGVLRLWTCDGVVLHSLLVSDVPVNCITFDQLGTRLFAGDAAGTLTEVSLDLTPLSTAAAGSWSQAGWGAGLGPGSSPSSCDGLQPGGGGGSCGEAGAAASGGGGSGNRFAGGQTASGGAGLVASVLRHGSTATQQLAGAQLMRKLRVSQELAGCPIMSLTCHPGGHHLIALARSPKGVSDLVALNAKLLLVARRFSGIRCSNAPIKFALSPDGQFVLCGSEDGTVTIWDFATATPTPVGHMALGHAPIHSMAWSSAFHAVAVCSFGHFAPIRVLGCAAEQPQVALKPPCPEAARGKVPQAHQELVTSDMHRPLRCPLPDQLTPAHVRALLSDLRLSASQRGLYNQASDAAGQLQLMVPAHPKGRHLPRRLGSSRPGTGSGHGPAPGPSSSGSSSSDAGVPSGRTLQLPAHPGVLWVGGVDAVALHRQQGSLQQPKGGLTLQVSAAGDLQQDGHGPQQEQQQSQALIAAAPQAASQPTMPRVIDGTPKACAAAAAAPWQS